MSTLEISAPPALPVSPRQPRTWYFLGSAVVALLAYIAFNLGHLAMMVVAFVWHGDPDMTEAQIVELASQGGNIAAGTIAACALVVAVLWAAIRIARQGFADYLALRWPSRDELLHGLAITLAFLLAWLLLSFLAGHPTPAFVIDSYRSAQDAGLLWLLLIGFCVAAPVTEELVVRGLLYRGWSQSFLGPIGTIVLSSALWALMHQQYSWYYICQIFLVGLIFGHLRRRSGSTWLTVITHGFFNLAVLAYVALKLAYF
ncbi:CPBP family intramembrane glutamic endopeptidase [Bradyrhizobium sp. AUGA SZCCT0431]|uniref:CPBP family intramembrane glutamic endopeptidase n=1 Tax=Bradyrhizobium sp. AUGA SZCCT0431 TaxID=2807674 RepID=UPI001BAA4E7E|nr:CPBP family intramembrane glutamic endopeptidase [Bradyrhizobium sp. AUGA SZCCT0431]MBR1146889.1 CPBP family intramembrane metalloprotease [Bradyrhizobium sp. AUGA SZCCT0431]